MGLNLKKTIAFIDLETTGLSISNDKIVEISILKLAPDNSVDTLTLRINPDIKISEESIAIHGITEEDVRDEPVFAKVAKNIVKFIGNADISGYNVLKFDLPLLMEEFLRVEVDFNLDNRKVVDVQHIFHKMERRDLKAAYKFYCNKVLENAHSAEADITATKEILLAQVEKYDELDNTVESLSDFTGNQIDNMVDLAGRIMKNEDGEEIFNFGKYKGRKVTDIFDKDPSYYGWMINNDFPLYTKKKLTELILKWKSENR